MKYKTIVIDPPWDIQTPPRSMTDSFRSDQVSIKRKNQLHNARARSTPYDTMTDDEIINFPINDFADENCDLFLWCTNKKLPIAFEILQKWNMKYRACITWDKRQGNALHGIYKNTEFCLYGGRGKVILDYSICIKTGIQETRTSHSVKPKIFYDMLAKSTPEPRIDIFARQRHYGFDAWGDQVETPANTMEEYI